MQGRPGPLLTAKVHQALLAARAVGESTLQCSLDLDRSTTAVEVGGAGWSWDGRQFPFLEVCKDRTVYHWLGVDAGFQPVARFTTSLVKLVPTQWGPPTFEIDGIKMLPTAQVSPYADAERKVGLIQPGGKEILDTCGGLGYFAAHCLRGHARRVQSFEKNPDVIWLRSCNPWSPDSPWRAEQPAALTLTWADVAEEITRLPADSFDAILHDPPRFAIAGKLYSQAFYNQLARVLRRRGRLFHYTGAPNSLSRGRDLQGEVAARLRDAGFSVMAEVDGVLATKGGRLNRPHERALPV
ncbi:MAG: SAM-dependent methyltransferase [Proteobacteria bacterium]|nr:SAM-dependent methyltransferase [Pseudomonadota bacterium]